MTGYNLYPTSYSSNKIVNKIVRQDAKFLKIALHKIRIQQKEKQNVKF